ncbi:phospholipase D-like domain-containing protein [Siccirubricoccus sp. KC 17139]|uniref:Phospholipase D n=1 Tax=Siccirubricoccus soli TaxID=2899147 RepID=A0ABT1D7U6_9PROT|nr:phospholipase D-like domain-containing protein [Siccirubricoccus soli]MCO6418011.1 phospholipase D-like domain-containing protein [Siccirubricoccus soli]MCP2684146.1 phospholipase D-like domain-containing protein [Siccirubricoccus soli]
MNDALTTLLGTVWGLAVLFCLWFATEVLRSRRQEQAMTAWLLLFALIPPLGALLYLGFGSRKLRQRAARKPRPAGRQGRAVQQVPAISDLDRLIQSHDLPAATGGNAVTLCGTAAGAYETVLGLIARAERSLWVTTYILGTDQVAAEIIRRLAERAAAGVQVRLLIDDVGSQGVRERDLAPLVAAGGRVARFMPMSLIPRPRRYANLRNHRKIIVVDGCLAWSGGMNLSDAYLGPAPVAFRFRDLSFTVEGPAARVYAEVFAADWLFAAGEDLHDALPQEAAPASSEDSGVVQVVPAGPEREGDPIHDLLLAVAHRAERRLWIVTPYFVPDTATLKALVVAARRGVDVRLVTNRRSDSRLMDFASTPYLRALAGAGARTLRLRDGMLHAKAVVADDGPALVGTANLDQRSLFLNFEIMALFHGPEEARAVAAWLEPLAAECGSELPRPRPIRQMAEGFIRLFAPVL